MGEACLPRRTPVKQKATAILYCLGLLQLKTTHAMARFCSLLTELLHVKNRLFVGMCGWKPPSDTLGAVGLRTQSSVGFTAPWKGKGPEKSVRTGIWPK